MSMPAIWFAAVAEEGEPEPFPNMFPFPPQEARESPAPRRRAENVTDLRRRKKPGMESVLCAMGGKDVLVDEAFDGL
jgi:hypothetical protein